MLFKKIKLKIILFFKVFILAPKVWRKPNKANILIYDACGADFLLPYFQGRNVDILYVRGESINLHCLFQSFFKKAFWSGKCLKSYLDCYIEAVSPVLAVTLIDNSYAFYGLSKAFPNVKTILVQNGVRDNWLDLIANNTNYHVDYMCVFGYYVGKYYNKHISGNIIPIGSFKNNEIEKVKKAKDTDNILFISQWLNKPKTKEPFYFDYKGLPIYWEDFFEAETSLLNFLSDWCFVNNKKLVICGREKVKDSSEYEFYIDKLSNSKCSWKFIPRKDHQNSYKLLDSSQIVVSIDSTLGYESISRGNKTAIFSIRGSYIGNNFRKFGWPNVFPENGPFWTNSKARLGFHLASIMDLLNKSNPEEWNKIYQPYAEKLMQHDPKNEIFRKLINKILSKTER